MVKGISRQVIVVQSPEPKLFEQAIFILKDGAAGEEGVTDEALLREARMLMAGGNRSKKQNSHWLGPVWACGGAVATGLLWLVTSYL